MAEINLDEIISVPSTDVEMETAMAEAKASFDEFRSAIAAPKPGQEDFSVKVRFVRDGETEHIWVNEVNLSSNRFTGELANEPRLAGLKVGGQCTFDESRISDWMYVDKGKIAGGFTVKVLMRRQYEKKLEASFVPRPRIN